MRDKVYEVSRRSLLEQMTKRRDDCAKNHMALKSKDSSYANSIAAMWDMYSDIVELISNTPDS